MGSTNVVDMPPLPETEAGGRKSKVEIQDDLPRLAQSFGLSRDTFGEACSF